uniref:hypothetical protein n=1 Tax=Pararhizobium sp. IMCC3301 TaxID=3067904 RepID=UPI002741E591|nr:hypothetical protein [Pararhizobium sp. IMCC3301]
MQLMKSKGFRCKEDRAKDLELTRHYGAIGIRSVQAAQALCSKAKPVEVTKAIAKPYKSA